MKTRKLNLRLLFRLISVIIFGTVITLLSNCTGAGGKKTGSIDSTKGLKDFYKSYFDIGVAIAPQHTEGADAEFLKRHFNSITAENVMKPALIHPEENRYSWENADKIVDFAIANGMKVRGHTLCWHAQTGEWMFKDASGNQASKELALARLKDHITTVVTRYKDKVYAWDVLNEAIVDSDTAKNPYRETPWYKICGEEYIAKIFQWAHEADPDALLVYNDYNTENPGKRDRIYTMLKKLLDEGVPVHAVGLQGHWSINDPTEENLRATIDKFSSLGLKVQITELDVSIYTDRADTLNIGFTPEREQKQIDLYKMAFNVFREKKNVINSVTFWNLSDRASWRDRRGPGKCYPLLFDVDMKPKKVFWEVVKF
ncbi:MAG TPA: endo-1,4-beta-xylanase [Bacteroidales bacterium]|jgi:endo-1,4-beta-xylanase|nr:1,4-beta-xylanase [Bacteroidales bacterium]OQB63257.1 MAG: Endo-1,4-beta-xylanase B [Bacteroidetes bacterium ADurb.Bin145]NMD02745.1 endo-1,4-beta-xylanase [Bacteroidales bacterium]HOU01210.1 endo-1,4-beta-xylanase [Bacteroidales bacterium]HQG62054.1 endo-1,4-beta-xylanase [Bacteroidales bacterium]